MAGAWGQCLSLGSLAFPGSGGCGPQPASTAFSPSDLLLPAPWCCTSCEVSFGNSMTTKSTKTVRVTAPTLPGVWSGQVGPVSRLSSACGRLLGPQGQAAPVWVPRAQQGALRVCWVKEVAVPLGQVALRMALAQTLPPRGQRDALSASEQSLALGRFLEMMHQTCSGA